MRVAREIKLVLIAAFEIGVALSWWPRFSNRLPGSAILRMTLRTA